MYMLLYMAMRQLWKENERSRIRVVQLDNLRGLQKKSIRRMNKVPNARIREL